MITIPGLETYFGGKGSTGVYQTLINLMPEHEVYVSAFMGGDALMRRKKPARINIGIDLDPKVINYWVNAMGHQMEASPPRYWTINGKINQLDLTVIYTDAISYLQSLIGKKKFFGVPDKQVLIFLDPPYLISTKTSDTRYAFHMNDFQHEEMLEIIGKLPYHFLLTCYDNELYKRKLKGWNNKEFFNYDRANKKRTETAYFNYPIPAKLHEYTFVGSNYRKREDLKRKIKRHVAKFMAMPAEERNALLQALNSIDGVPAVTGISTVTSAPVQIPLLNTKEAITWDFTENMISKTGKPVADHEANTESEKVMKASGSRMWWDRYLTPEYQKLFPFHYHSNFLVNQHGTEIFESLKCYKCGSTDTGNGCYYTGYMVWFSKDDIRFSCYNCLPDGSMQASHQEYGFRTPIILPEKFANSIKHKIVFQHFMTDYIGYAIKKYAGGGITLNQLLSISDHIKCNGWGHNWNGNCIEGYNGKLNVRITNDPLFYSACFTMTKNEILQHINDILLLNSPENAVMELK